MKEITFCGQQVLSPAVTPLILRAYQFLRETDLESRSDGRMDILGDDLFAVFQSYHTAPAETLEFEAHRKYIDLQYIISGQERILASDLSELTEETVPYDSVGDIVFYKDPEKFETIDLQGGDFVFFSPKDAHKTRCDQIPGGCNIHKVIVKILLK